MINATENHVARFAASIPGFYAVRYVLLGQMERTRGKTVQMGVWKWYHIPTFYLGPIKQQPTAFYDPYSLFQTSSNFLWSTANPLTYSHSISCIFFPQSTKLCNGLPMSACANSSNVPATIF